MERWLQRVLTLPSVDPFQSQPWGSQNIMEGLSGHVQMQKKNEIY